MARHEGDATRGRMNDDDEVLAEAVDFDQVMVTTAAGERVFLVATDAGVRGWLNRCPHLGIEMDYGDGRCLFDGVLVCAMHAATFDPQTGQCTAGPCTGDFLEARPVRIDEAGRVRLCAGS